MKRFIIALLVFLLCFPCISVQAEAAAPHVSAYAAILINADTGAVVFEKNSLERRAMASTTKIMSALLTLEAGDLDKRFKVDSMAIRVEGSSMGLREGDIVTRRALAYGMLLPSGNDAAGAAAVSVSGSVRDFVKLMNERAERMGLKDTRFANPSGLDAEVHYSTAYDMALLTMHALRNKDFAYICSRQSVKTEFGSPPFGRWLYNNNKLLYMYSGTIGVKTGFTDNAGRCLVSAAERDGVTLIAVTLRAPNDWRDHAAMFDYGFSVVKNQPVDYDTSELYVSVAGGENEKTRLKLAETPVLPLSDAEMRLIDIKVKTIPFIYRGFAAGEQAGLLEFRYNGKLLRIVPLITAEACQAQAEKLSPIASFFQFLRRLH